MTQPTGPAWDYLRWFHETNVWKHMSYRGVRTLKYPPDMWNYQEIICEHKIEWIVETGTRHGGSALFFADLFTNLGRKGKVFTIDPMAEWQLDHTAVPNLVWLKADSGATDVAASVYRQIPEPRGPLFLILDADHSAQHVARELAAHVPFLRSGDYLIVEDTIVNGHLVRPEHGPGPMEAIDAYVKQNPGRLVYDQARAEKFGSSVAMKGYYRVA
ncbi:MAG: rhamnosyl O-methyltransferase [Alphaproteobacteria bacterium]|nr:rhamnosyl O-methyltransferase [Alphaproteobacteria bacterium]